MKKLAQAAPYAVWLLTIACGSVEKDRDPFNGDETELCALYEDTCGYSNAFGGDAYASASDCAARLEGYNDVRLDCVLEHLSFASNDPALHCPHAEGATPCDRVSSFCVQYDLTCGYENDYGGTPYENSEDCELAFESYSQERRLCVEEHLGFASNNAPLHCPHVAGEPPCD